MVKRRGRSQTPADQCTNAASHGREDGEPVCYMDEDDQDELVTSLQDDAIRQAKQFHKFFAFVCLFAIFVTVLYPWLCPVDCSNKQFRCWIHTGYSVLLHALDIALQKHTPFENTPQSTMIGMKAALFISSRGLILAAASLTVLPLVLLLVGAITDDVEDFHLGLIVGNMVTFGGLVLLRWDAASTNRALEELNGSKYKYKDL